MKKKIISFKYFQKFTLFFNFTIAIFLCSDVKTLDLGKLNRGSIYIAARNVGFSNSFACRNSIIRIISTASVLLLSLRATLLHSIKHSIQNLKKSPEKKYCEFAIQFSNFFQESAIFEYFFNLVARVLVKDF
jgi:hypothetical protein